MKSVRRSKVSAAFLEASSDDCAQGETRQCATQLRFASRVFQMYFAGAVASIFDAAGAAEAIRREFGGLFRDGTLALIMASILTTA